MRIIRTEEFLLAMPVRKEIHQLLLRCFSEYPKDQTYYKQLPDFRLLAYDKETLAAHMAVEHRLININGKVFRIFGISDLCVAPEHQSQNLASTLLLDLEVLGKKIGIDFLVLISNEHEFYKKNGFHLVNNTCRWLMINDHKTLGVGHRRIEGCLMVKALGTKEWEAGSVDFLGHIF